MEIASWAHLSPEKQIVKVVYIQNAYFCHHAIVCHRELVPIEIGSAGIDLESALFGSSLLALVET